MPEESKVRKVYKWRPMSIRPQGRSQNGWKRDTRNDTKKLINVDKKNELDVTFLFFISLLIVAQHVPGNHVPIIRS